MATTDPRNWKQEWRSTDRGRRQRVIQAVQAGERLGNPADARLALGLAQSWRRQFKVLRCLIPIAMLIYVVIGLRSGRNAALVLGSCVLLGAFISAIMLPILRMHTRRLERAEDANRTMSGQ